MTHNEFYTTKSNFVISTNTNELAKAIPPMIMRNRQKIDVIFKRELFMIIPLIRTLVQFREWKTVSFRYLILDVWAKMEVKIVIKAMRGQ